VVAALACGEATGVDSFSGLWQGSNPAFTLFQLNLQQVGDAVHGSVQFVFAAPPATWADTDFVAVTVADSLRFTIPVPPSTGHTAVEFRGQRRGERIDGIANGALIVLIRQ
jgi:hypothetical protein